MWTESTGLNWDIPCGELAQDSFLEWNEPPGTMSRWQESVAALLSRDSLKKGMHRKSRFEHSCTSHSQSQHMCLNGYPRAIQSGDYYLQYSGIIVWAGYVGVLQHQTIPCETWTNPTVLGSPWIWESSWERWNTAMEMRMGEKGKPGNQEETSNPLQWVSSNPEIRFSNLFLS